MSTSSKIASKPRVLLVDDDATLLEGLARSMHRQGFSVQTAGGAEQALAEMELSPADVLVADHQMPGIQGVGLLARIAQRWPDCHRILFTGHATLKVAMDAINRGQVDRLVLKPCDSSELAHLIRRGARQARVQQVARGLLTRCRWQEERIRTLEQASTEVVCAPVDDYLPEDLPEELDQLLDLRFM
jgi:DNA-binding NtrC family response regulator